MDRERQLIQALVGLADTLVDDYDVTDLLHELVEHCVDLLSADAAGLLLSDQRGGLQVVASSTERTRLLELFQLQNNEGPCLDCYRSGESVLVPDLATESEHWPRFVPEATKEGFRSVHALPLRLRSETIGAMNLFKAHSGALSDEDLRVGRALADMVTIGILQERSIRRTETLSEQLQGALNSRVVIEQAKGVLAAQGSLDMDTAFSRLRRFARNHNRHLRDVARGVVEGTIELAQVVGVSTTSKGRGSDGS
jgi:transcriptional regulator with GAF, ATPase, and Fis domain